MSSESGGARDVVVIGGSAGSIEVLTQIVRAFPAELPAAVFVVVHIAPSSPSVLRQILGRAAEGLEAPMVTDGAPVQRGRLYVAPPDQHLIVEEGHVRLLRGPRENGHRPALDPLFRSAAEYFGKRVIGVVLSGNLDDGTMGLRAVKEHGGVAIVQNPITASFGGMPRSAIEHVDTDHVLDASAIGPAIAKIIRESQNPDIESRQPPKKDPEPRSKSQVDPVTASMEPGSHPLAVEESQAELVPLTCPECNGNLWQVDYRPPRYRCRVGHSYSEQVLTEEKGKSVEAALWSAVEALQENATMAHRLARRAENGRRQDAAVRYRRQASDMLAHANVILEVLKNPLALPGEEVRVPEIA